MVDSYQGIASAMPRLLQMATPTADASIEPKFTTGSLGDRPRSHRTHSFSGLGCQIPNLALSPQPVRFLL